MNLVVLKGNVTRDPDLRYTPNQTAVVTFSIAINEVYKEKEYTTFVDCEAWARQAEVIAEYIKKGRPILVEGSLKQDKWEVDGEKRSRMLVRVSRFEFCGGKPPTDADSTDKDTVSVGNGQEPF